MTLQDYKYLCQKHLGINSPAEGFIDSLIESYEPELHIPIEKEKTMLWLLNYIQLRNSDLRML